MQRIYKSEVVAHSAAQMFELVEHIERYPEFLPWCYATAVRQRGNGLTIATLFIRYLGINQSLTTENHHSPYAIYMNLKKGPFRKMSGRWEFIPIDEHCCQINFSLDYEFANIFVEALLGPAFAQISGTLVEAFIKRADALYR